jgi:hypothetical protein
VKARTLLLLALATLIALAVAWTLQREPGPRAPGQPFLPELASLLGDIEQLSVQASGSEAFTLHRDAEGWSVPTKGGYPVDTATLRGLLRDLAEARVLETKTSNPALHHRLGVELVDGRPGSGVLLRLGSRDRSTAVVIGQRETRGLPGTHVRRLDEDTALLVDRDLQPAREPVDWLEREILDVAVEEVLSLEIERPDGERLVVERDDLGIFAIANLPEGRRPSGPTAAEAVARGLSGLRLDDVRPASDGLPEHPPTRAVYRLSDGLVIEARNWESLSMAGGADHWVAFSARAEGDEATIERAAALNSRLTPWLYRLPAWRHEQLTRRLEDLLAREPG